MIQLKYIFVVVCLSLSSVMSGQITATIDKSVHIRLFDDYNNSTKISSMADSLLNYAYSYLKTPYRMGATGTKAFDCSGFSGFVYRNFGFKLERTAACQASVNGIEVDRNELKPGDLVFFKGRNAKQKRVGHVGIVVDADEQGNFSFIHASIKLGVTITESRKDYYNTRYVTARRIISENDMVPQEVSPIEVRIPSLTVH